MEKAELLFAQQVACQYTCCGNIIQLLSISTVSNLPGMKDIELQDHRLALAA
jgi:hypothetical protein